MLGNEGRQRLRGWLAPADAEGMPGGVGVDLVTFVRIRIRSGSEQSSTEFHSLLVGRAQVLHMQVEMHLLWWAAMRPVGWDMVRCQLHADAPLSSGVDDAMPPLVLEDLTAEHARPERALSVQVGCVENNHLPDHLHAADTMGSRPIAERGLPGVRA